MKSNNKPKGNFGENLAAAYLTKKGYKIISRNFNSKFGEIDIITVFKNILIFVEVKTRSGEQFGSPIEAVTPWKIKSITSCAQYFKLLHPTLPEAMQIDVIGINLSENGQVSQIQHLSNVTG